MDKCTINFSSEVTADFDILSVTDNCFKCAMTTLANVSYNNNITIDVDSRFRRNLTIYTATNRLFVCSRKQMFWEGGDYNFVIFEDLAKQISCHLDMVRDPISTFAPIYVALASIVGVAVFVVIFDLLRRRGIFNLLRRRWNVLCDTSIRDDLGNPQVAETLDNDPLINDSPKEFDSPPPNKRVQSVDAMRGLSLLLMIFVNYGGGGYWFFKHSTWNGITVADLVFPWFTFIMGMSLVLSLHGMLRRGSKRKFLLFKILKRSIILFALGLMISNPGHHGPVRLKQLRIMGVLQRLSIAYLTVGTLEAVFTKTDYRSPLSQIEAARDILSSWPQWLIMIALMTLHGCLTFLLPIDNGCPRGYLGPGGLSENGLYENCTGGAAGYIDRIILGRSHMYQHPTCKETYQTTEPFDPEGILGCITAAFTCFLGAQAARILRVFTYWRQQVSRWALWALLTGVCGAALCNFRQNGGIIPVNKNLWSLSFTFCLSSMAFGLLVLFYLLIDVANVWNGAPLRAVGMNSLVLYCGHELLHRCFPVSWHVEATHSSKLAMDLYGTILWMIVALIMHHKKVYISV